MKVENEKDVKAEVDLQFRSRAWIMELWIDRPI
jgi:hypothetical protein